MTILHNDIIKNIECFFPEVFSHLLPKNLKKLDMLAHTGYIVTYMGSEPLYVFKRQYPNGDIVEVKIWRVDKSADKPHGFKYSLAFVRKGNRLIGYDNAEGKGDHRHYTKGKSSGMLSAVLMHCLKISTVISGGTKKMRVQNVRLEIQDEDDFTEDVKAAMSKIESGATITPQAVISFESLKVMRKFITDERLKILKAIRKYKPGSIYELAKILKRDTKNVSDDVHYLEEIGLIEIEKTRDGREKSTPHVNYDKILLEIPVA